MSEKRVNRLVKERWFSKYVEKNIPSLDGKNVAVTGTTSGTGFYVVISAIRKHAQTVFVLNRASSRVEKSLKAFEDEKAKLKSGTQVVQIDCDLGSFESVRKAADILKDEVKSRELPGIDVLVNNAGIAGLPLPKTADGFQSQMQINYLSHFLLVDLIKPELEAAANVKNTPSRIVNVSSGMRWFVNFEARPYHTADDKLEQENMYGQSKLAMALFSYEYNRRNDVNKVFCVVADPGMSATDIAEKKGKNEPKKDMFGKFIIFINNYSGMKQSASDGSMPLVEAAFGVNVSPNDFIAPGGFQTVYGEPKKIIDAGTSKWTFYKEKNILDPKAAKALWEVTLEALKI